MSHSSLEGIIAPSLQLLKPEDPDLAIRTFEEIIVYFEPLQIVDSGYKLVTLIKLMENEVSEKDEFLDLFFSYTRQDLRFEEQRGLAQVLSYLSGHAGWSAEEENALSGSLLMFAKYLVDKFFLPLKALAVKTPKPTPALSHVRTPEAAIDTPQRVSNLRRDCLIRDHHRCVISRKFDAQEGQIRYKRDNQDIKDDDGKSLLPERDLMVYLEVAHIIPYSLMLLTSEEGERRLVDSKQIEYKILKMFNPSAIYLINGVDINRLINALIMTYDFYKLFGNFEIAFQPVNTKPYTYTIDYVKPDRMGRVKKLPVTVTFYLILERSIDFLSPQLLQIYSAIGRILYVSAAGDYIDEFFRDIEELEGGQVIPDGSTRLDEYVWFRLNDQMPLK